MNRVINSTILASILFSLSPISFSYIQATEGGSSGGARFQNQMGGGSGNGKPQPSRIKPVPNKPLTKAGIRNRILNNNTVTRSKTGLLFPRNANNYSSCCKVGEQRTITAIPFSHVGKKRQRKSWDQTKNHEYFSGGCWVFDSAKLRIHSISKGGSYSTSTVRKGLNYSSNFEYSSVTSYMFDMIASLDIPDVVKGELKAKMQEYLSTYLQLNQSFNSSHDGFIVKTTVNGTGWANTRRARNWVKGDAKITETCLPPEARHSEPVKKALVEWLNEAVKQLKAAGAY